MPLVSFALIDSYLAIRILPRLAGLDEHIVWLLRACAAIEIPNVNYSLAEMADGLLEGRPIQDIDIWNTDLNDNAAYILAEFAENHPFLHTISIGEGSI